MENQKKPRPQKDGGPGSGYFNHPGRKGQRGGSVGRSGGESSGGNFSSFGVIKKIKKSGGKKGPKVFQGGKEVVQRKKTCTEGVPFIWEDPDGKLNPNSVPKDRPETEVDTALREQTSRIWRELDEAGKDALYDYTGSNSDEINEQLRFGKDRGVGEQIQTITETIEKTSLPAIWLTRGISDEGAAGYLSLNVSDVRAILRGEVDPALLIGTVHRDEGFMSCGATQDKGFADICNVELQLYCPPGTKGLYVEPVSEYGNGQGRFWDGESGQKTFGLEQEIILQRGTEVAIRDARLENRKLQIQGEVIRQRL